MTKEEKCNEDLQQQPSFIKEHPLVFTEGYIAGYERAQSEFKNLGIGEVSNRRELLIAFCEWCNANNEYDFIHKHIVDKYLSGN